LGCGVKIATEVTLESRLLNSRSIHILGAGLNKERTAHTAVGELSQRGWRVVPIHPRDAGATISGVPIRSRIEDGVELDVVVLFLAPERAQAVVRNLLHRDFENPPLVWFQPGAEDEIAISWLNDAGWQTVYDDCIVRFSERNNLIRSISPIPWFLQVQDTDDSGCSVWSVHEDKVDSDSLTTDLEWVGDLIDLELSNHVVPKYIRSLVADNESIEDCARRLAQ
jgi:hypothetical protein